MATVKYCICKDYKYITYEEYCLCVDEVLLDKNQLTPTDKQKFKLIINFLNTLKIKISAQLKLMNIAYTDMVKAFFEKEVFNLLQILKFNITLLFKAMGAAQLLIANGLLKVLSDIAKHENMKLFKSKVIKVDQYINKHPILKKVSGLALCGLIIFMWCNMTFIGDFNFDFNLSMAFEALYGTYTITDMLTTDSGLLFIALFFTGIATPINFNWILKIHALMPIMIIYTASKNEVLKKQIKYWIKTYSQKVNSIQYKYSRIPYYDPTKLRA